MDKNKSESDSKSEKIDLYTVCPKKDCPHYKNEHSEKFSTILEELGEKILKSKCRHCEVTKENWVCLECEEIYCSRFQNEHMVLHSVETEHKVVFSLADASFWCYFCDSYITNLQMDKLRMKFSNIKFPDNKDFPKDLINELKGLSIKDNETQENFNRDKFISGLKEGKYKKIAVLTGAGISVASGIPDFRTPGIIYLYFFK